MSSFDVGPLSTDDLPKLRSLMSLAFGDHLGDDAWERDASLLEPGRSLAVRDGNRLVGHASAYTFTMSVPSGRTMPVAGVTWVGVSPSHRRRGVARTLMHDQLAELASSGEAVAALWASEPSIYGRFGYGLASRSYSVKLPRAFNQTRPVPGSELLLVEVAALDDELRERCAAVYANGVLDRPGAVYRGEAMSAAAFSDLPDERHGASDLRCVLCHDGEGNDVGYAVFAIKLEWHDTGAASEVHVREFVALTPPAHARVMGCLLNLDLTALIRMQTPLDDPLLTTLLHLRRAEARVGDQLWVRLTDVPRALEQRSYSADIDLVLDVRDHVLPANARRWRLTGGSDGAQCVASDATPDLTLDVRELGAAFLGDQTFMPAGGAGLIEEHTQGALLAAARAFGHEPRPYISFVF